MATCTSCGETKGLSEFGFRNAAAGRRQKACKACVAAHGRQHYLANKPSYIARNNRLSRARTLALKPRIWDYVAEHPCVNCGLADPLILEFDHVGPSTKRKTINKLVRQAYSWFAIRAEIEHCEVRAAIAAVAARPHRSAGQSSRSRCLAMKCYGVTYTGTRAQIAARGPASKSSTCGA
jgi:hypothetical protein